MANNCVKLRVSEQGRQTPYEHARAEDHAAGAAICPQSERQGSQRVDEGERAAQQTDAEVAQVEFRLDERGNR